MRHPAAGPVLGVGALVAGIVSGEHAGAAPAGLTLTVGLVIVAGAWLLDGVSRRVVIAIALMLLGGAVMQRALHGLTEPALDRAIARSGSQADAVHLRGVLVTDPDGPRFGASALVRADTFDRIVLVKATGDDAGRLRALAAGDHADFEGRLDPIPDDGFDARARWSHAAAMLVESRIVAFTPAQSPLARVANWTRDRVLNGTRPLDVDARALVAGFLLGDTRGIPADVIDDYRDAGLSHLLAVSGANVAFVLVVFAPMLRRLSLAGRTAAALSIIVCFAAATRFEPSVLRATALATVTIFATFVGRPVAPLRALALAVIALLLIDPFLVHSVGFQLSCAASAGIACFAAPLARALPGPRLLREPLGVSIGAQIGVTPVLLATFGSVPVVSPLANLFAAPAAEALGVFGLLACVVGGVLPPLGAVLAPFVELLVAWVSAVAHATAGLGGELRPRSALLVSAIVLAVYLARRVYGWLPGAS